MTPLNKTIGPVGKLSLFGLMGALMPVCASAQTIKSHQAQPIQEFHAQTLQPIHSQPVKEFHAQPVRPVRSHSLRSFRGHSIRPYHARSIHVFTLAERRQMMRNTMGNYKHSRHRRGKLTPEQVRWHGVLQNNIRVWNSGQSFGPANP
ncbi:MAG TPA: hypothetical protein VFB38_06800 [Chthonomonadaceae bacterium]|nr:hypothetical protein [Chthonomonadaceae bacterium]